MPLLPPKFNNDAVRVVYDALLAGKRFTAEYRSRAADTDELRTYEVSPLGLVARGPAALPRLHALGLPRHPSTRHAPRRERHADREES